MTILTVMLWSHLCDTPMEQRMSPTPPKGRKGVTGRHKGRKPSVGQLFLSGSSCSELQVKVGWGEQCLTLFIHLLLFLPLDRRLFWYEWLYFEFKRDNSSTFVLVSSGAISVEPKVHMPHPQSADCFLSPFQKDARLSSPNLPHNYGSDKATAIRLGSTTWSTFNKQECP